MKVIDANVVVELIAFDLDPSLLGVEPLAAPHLIDCEVMNSLRGLELEGELTPEDASRALVTFAAMAIERYAEVPLRSRIWELRHNLSAYDAAYVALAESLRATSLLTSDSGIGHAPGIRCVVEAV